LLTQIRAGQSRLEKMGRFDMASFRPREAWVREMIRYGVLPPNTEPATIADFRTVEQRYWQSLWYRP
jgi:hypothetical protein